MIRIAVNNYNWTIINNWTANDLAAAVRIYFSKMKDLPTIFKSYNIYDELLALKLDFLYFAYIHNRVTVDERQKLDQLLLNPQNTTNIKFVVQQPLEYLSISWAVKTGFQQQMINNQGMLIALHIIVVKNQPPWIDFLRRFPEDIFIRLMSQQPEYIKESAHNLQIKLDDTDTHCDIVFKVLLFIEQNYGFILRANKYMSKKMLDFVIEADPSRLDKVKVRIECRINGTDEPAQPPIYNAITIPDVIWYYWMHRHATVEKLEQIWKTRDHQCLDRVDDVAIKLKIA